MAEKAETTETAQEHGLLLSLEGVTIRVWDRLILPDTHPHNPVILRFFLEQRTDRVANLVLIEGCHEEGVPADNAHLPDKNRRLVRFVAFCHLKALNPGKIIILIGADCDRDHSCCYRALDQILQGIITSFWTDRH